jgi:hypothetical protein
MHKGKKWWKKLKSFIPFVLLVLTLIVLLLDLPKKLSEFYNSITGGKTVLRGIVKDSLDKPIEGVVLKIAELPADSAITTTDGGFYFPKISGKPGDRVRLYVYEKGHKPHNEYVTLPGPVRVVLEK